MTLALAYELPDTESACDRIRPLSAALLEGPGDRARRIERGVRSFALASQGQRPRLRFLSPGQAGESVSEERATANDLADTDRWHTK